MTAKRLNHHPEVGTVYEADWLATSASANNVQLTKKLSLPAGTYVVTAMLPGISTSEYYAGLHYGSNGDLSRAMGGALYANGTWPLKLSSQMDVWLESRTSLNCSFNVTDRAKLRAVRIA